MVQVGPLHVERTTNGSLATHITIGLIAKMHSSKGNKETGSV